MERPKLGSKVVINAIVKKSHIGTANFFRTEYVREERKCQGFYIGYRFVVEGTTETEEYGSGKSRYFIPGNVREVWLVVVDPRKNSFTVAPEDVVF